MIIYEGQLMQRKYRQFPVRTVHLVKTTRLLNHKQTIARLATDIVTLVLAAYKNEGVW